MWSLMDPDAVPGLSDLWGEEFDTAYRAAEAEGRYVRQVKARDLYGRMMRTLAQTGNGWMTFKDASNARCNQTGVPGNVVHLSNLCTEILEVSTDDQTAVCNLGSVNLARHLAGSTVDWEKLRETVRTAVPFLDRVVDVNYYPSAEAAASNPRWRPIGLGVMGLQDVFFPLRLPFDSPEARELSTRIAEEIYLTALEASASLAAAAGPFPAWEQSRTAAGQAAAGPVGRRADPGRALDRAAGAGRRDRAAQLAADRDRADRDDRLDRRLLRVHRAAGVQPVQARDPVRGVPPGQLRAGARAQPAAAGGTLRPGRRSSAPTGRSRTSELPAETNALFRTAWELPQRALIDLAAARGPYVDQSQSLNLFLAAPTIGKLSSMYLYAWKAGLKTTYYLRSRPATRIQQATPWRRRRRHSVHCRDAEASPARWRTPSAARPASEPIDRDPTSPHSPRPGHGPDPAAHALPALLRPVPRRHPNTWTVEEVDLHSDLADLRRLSPAEHHLVNRLVAFFATGDTIVANNLVLNLYQHVNSPRAGSTCPGSCSRRPSTSSST